MSISPTGMDLSDADSLPTRFIRFSVNLRAGFENSLQCQRDHEAGGLITLLNAAIDSSHDI